MPVSARHESRFAKCCYYCRTITTFLFSHIGLCALVLGYATVGAITFQAIESPKEKDSRRAIADEWLHFPDKIWKITENSSVLIQEEWSQRVAKELTELENNLVIAFKNYGYDGKDEASLQWDFFGALLYSIIVITTIGYGNIAPKTWIGKLVTILYAIIGIPLMLLFLSNIGDAMANTAKFLYWKVCCILCVSPKKSPKHNRRRNHKKKKKKKVGQQIALQTMSRVRSDTVPNRVSSLRTSEDRGMGSTPIICNMYALQTNHLDDSPEPYSKVNAYLNRPFHTLPHNFSLSNTNRSPLPTVPQTTQLVGNRIVPQRVSQRIDEESDYTSDESIESDSEIQDIPNVPIRFCVALVVGYICGGGFLFRFLENWSFLDASYFSFVTLTTIGFGDLVPGTNVFDRDDAKTILGICALYLLFGMALLAMSFNLVKEEVTKKIRFIGKRIGILTKDENDCESD